MNREVEIYIEGTTVNNYEKIDLFKDEFINISSSIQNIQDLSKVYTDFSQSFTVPSTPNNDRIFEYFYQNDVDNSIDHNLRRYAYIEVGKTPFRSGKIQLEGSIVKNSKAEHYTITFYGDLVSLKDIFSNKKLRDLDFSAIPNPYTGAGVKARLTDTATDYDVRYPMISSNKLWTYGDASSTDLSTTTGRLSWNDLFPAIKVSKIFQAIQTDFGLTFNSTFLDSDLFKKLFLWCKNTDNQDAKMNGYDLIVDSYVDNVAAGGYNSTENSYTLIAGSSEPYTHDINFTITNPPSIGSGWVIYVDVYKDGIFTSTVKINTDTNNSLLVYTSTLKGSTIANSSIKLKIRSEQAINIQYTITMERYTYRYRQTFNDYKKFSFGEVVAKKTTSLVMSFSSNSINLNAPDITISDFFSGILKQFNLTCYATKLNTFTIEPLDDWYSKGGVIDITKYVDVDEINVDRLPLYKNISFNYEKSESVINRQFGDAYGREWGDTSLNYEYDGGDYNIKVPFENLEFQKYSTTPMQVGFSLTKAPDYKSYIPKPVLLYYNGAMTTSIKFYDGTTETTETNLALFGNDLSYNNQIYSLNFAPETSTWYDVPVQNSLFANYYFGYLSNLFNTKNRLTKLTAYFPISLITSLKLNDRLIIKDKRYLINTINSEITNGKVQLELINDFRPVKNLTIGVYKVSELGGTIKIPINLSNNVYSSTLTSPTFGVTFSDSLIYHSEIITVTVPANPNPVYEFISEEGYALITDDSFNLISEQGDDELVTVDVLETYTNGTTEGYTIEIIQG